jgi:ABC-type transport system substrate-binding protein
VTGVDIIDDHTVKLILSAPSASLLAQLTDRAGMIASPKAAQAAGENFGAHPVCAGPFKFVERVAQDRIVLERFADYWDKDSIKIDRIVYLPIPELWVVLHHALRNALIPVVTLGALEFGQLLSRAVLTEQVFTIPGFGKLIVDAVFNRDYAVVQGVVLCTALAYILLNLLADIAYAVVNPRLRG